MRLDLVAFKYIQFKRSMGMAINESERILKHFCQALGGVDISEVNVSQVLAFLGSSGSTAAASSYYKYGVLHTFYRFAVGRGHAQASPLPDKKPKKPDSSKPYIYSDEELKKLLDLTAAIESPWRPITARTLRALLILIYGAGLRMGEAVRLKVCDVDLKDRMITIRESKFYKTRLLPIGRKLSGALSKYHKRKSRRLKFLNEESTFFITRKGTAISKRQLQRAFKALLVKAKICRLDSGRYGPRLHDLRHSFAVHRLISWYRQGKDVQRLLPLLSTYLGHLSIEETKVYLSMTPELLSQANKRFEKYALSEECHE